MKEIDLEELKKIQLNILSEVHAFCCEHKIKYTLSEGTLLGAIRHKGYIPWDDDIDIYMLRPEMEKFEREFKHQYLKFISVNTDNNYSLPFPKVMDTRTSLEEDTDSNSFELGVNIDIFPIDSVPDDLNKRKDLFRKVRLINNRMILKRVKINHKRCLYKNIILGFGKLAMGLVTMRSLAKQMISLPENYNSASNDVANVMWGYGINSCFPNRIMYNYIDIEFEGRLFRCIKEYDLYLRITYGDYMQLPPVEKQVSHHAFKAWWK